MTTLDSQYAQAAQFLVKIAEENDVDLESLSEEQLAELLGEVKDELEDAQEGEGGDDAPPPPPEEKTVEEKISQLTHADVALELSKLAALEGVDMTKVAAHEYTQAFDELAAAMQTEEYWGMKVAEAEAYEKLAEADAIGRQMARGFMAELGTDKTASAVEKLRGALTSVGRGVTSAAYKGADAAYAAKRSLGAAGHNRSSALADKAGDAFMAAGSAARNNTAIDTGAAALGLGATGAVGAGLGAKALIDKARGGEAEKEANEKIASVVVDVLLELGLVVPK